MLCYTSLTISVLSFSTETFDSHYSIYPLLLKTHSTLYLSLLITHSSLPVSGSNWASRQGFTDVSRELLKSRHVGSNGITNTKQVKLGVAEEAFAGILGELLRL